jgi:putative ABC transport system permease protein
MESLLQDVRYAVRALIRTPGFTIVAVLTLALGIGANTAIFTLFDQVLLRSLPVHDPDRLVRLQFSGSDTGRLSSHGGSDGEYFSYPMYRALRDQNTVFSGMLATDSWAAGVQWHNQPEMVPVELVSGNYFDVLGVSPALGRLFAQSDDLTQNANPVVVLSFAYWKRRFGSDPTILNHTVLINSHPFVVIGVTPPGFHSVRVGEAPDVFAPMMMKPEVTPEWNDLDEPRSRWLNIVARPKPGVSRAAAEAGLNPLWRSLRQAEFKNMREQSEHFRQSFVEQSHVTLLDGSRGFSPLRESLRQPLSIVMAMVGLVLLFACANMTTLLLARGAGRLREISVRYALGAPRSRILQQLLIEGILLGMTGGAAGVLLAPQVSSVLCRQVVSDFWKDMPFSSQPDLRILLFNFGLTLIVSLIFSLAPALQFWHPDLAPALKQQMTTIAGGSMRVRRVAVGVQIGLSLLLLIGSGLFLRTLYKLKTVDVGFSTDHLLKFDLDPTLAGYEASKVPALYREITDSLAALPGVHSVAATDDPELANQSQYNGISIPGYKQRNDREMNVEWPIVTPGYFSTLQLGLLAGRVFSDQDGAAAAKVAVVNESLARHFFGSAQLAIGRFIQSEDTDGKKVDIQIVGVVRDSHHESVRADIARTVFIPYLQSENPGAMGMVFYVRTWQSPQTIEAAVAGAMREIDSKLVLNGMRTMDEQIDNNLGTERMIALLTASFGLLATLLAAVGIYGVLAYATAQRTREIGIRIALGSTRGAVARLVLSDVIALCGISMVIALPLALLLSRLIRSQLYGISNYDPVTVGVMSAIVSLVALLSAWIPTYRASRVDPMVALRYE